MTRHNDLKPANDDDVFEVGAPLRTGRLDEILGFHLRMANVAMYQDYSATMSELGLTQKQFAVLELIAANPGVGQIDIAHQPQLAQGFLGRAQRRALGFGDRRVLGHGTIVPSTVLHPFSWNGSVRPSST